MCTTLHTLAVQAGLCKITKCSCGIVHLTWGRTTIHLQIHELENIAHFLQDAQAQTLRYQVPYYKADEFGVVFTEDGHCQLWLFSTGLHLTHANFVRLSQLCCTAWRTLTDEKPDIEHLSAQIEAWLDKPRI